jgi:hypothetical protein
VNLAARGSRHLDEKPEKIQDAAELSQVRQQARRVHVKAILVALFCTLIALALP